VSDRGFGLLVSFFLVISLFFSNVHSAIVDVVTVKQFIAINKFLLQLTRKLLGYDNFC
jgi:hypothetical protein